MRSLLLALALLVLAPLGHAFDAGADAYRAGDLAAARAAWTAALQAEPPPSAAERARLCYDLGDVAYREERFAEAAAWFTAAVRLSPRDAAAWSNLELARSEAGLSPADRGDLSATVERLLGMWTGPESEWIALGAVLLWALALGFEALRGGRVARRLAWTGFGLVLVASLPAARHALVARDEPLFVLAEDGAEIASEPRDGAPKIARSEPGGIVERLDVLPGWTQVELADGTTGWAKSAELFALER